VIRPSLQEESAKLARSWTQHDAGMLRDYLVAGVEDPRINVQSVLSRHFLVRALTGGRFNGLMEQEYRFAAAMNWLTGMAGRLHDADELEVVLYALRQGADNAEGIEIPGFIVQTYAALPTSAGTVVIPNYVESFLRGTRFVQGRARPDERSLETFCGLWGSVLGTVGFETPGPGGTPGEPAGGDARATVSVLEPACGSANDYRFLHAYGLARLVSYTGFDLCAKNIENACAREHLTFCTPQWISEEICLRHLLFS